MIIGSLTQTKRFEILHPDFKKVFEYVRSGNWQQVTAGKIILEEDKIWVNVDEVTGKSREAAKLEAHHPTAIRYVIEATRVRYPGKKIVAIFQPDRFSRGARFAKEFAQEMDKADYPYFCPFPENAKHEDGIDIDISSIRSCSALRRAL